MLTILPIIISQQSTEHANDLSLSYYEDSTVSESVQSIIDLPSEDWKDIIIPEFGLSSSAYWIKATIEPHPQNHSRILRINYSAIDNIEIWFFESKSSANQAKALSYQALGDTLPFSERPIRHEQFIVDVPIASSDMIFIIKASSGGSVKVPIEKWIKSEFIEFSALYKAFMGLFFGYIIAILLGNIAIFAITKNVNFLIYTCYSACLVLGVASLHGFGFQYLWPNNLWLQEFSVVLFVSGMMISIITLSINLLSLKQQSLMLHRMHLGVVGLFALIILACFVLPYSLVLLCFIILLVSTTPLVFLSGLYIAFSGTLVHKLYCCSWAVLLSAGLLVALQSAGIFTTSINAPYMLAVGAIVEALLLSFALAVKYNEQTAKVSAAKRQALANQQAAIAASDELIAQQNENELTLKNRIAERKIELSSALYELAERNSMLTKLGNIDTLTGLSNRQFFDEQFDKEAHRSEREKTPLAVAVIDIDLFKQVNDTYGHLCGDHCLSAFADVLKQVIQRPTDIVCRYGGEEFVLVLPNTDAQGLKQILEHVRLATERKVIRFEGLKLSITVSAGGCSYVVNRDKSASTLFNCADKMLYLAKNAGRNCIKVETC